LDSPSSCYFSSKASFVSTVSPGIDCSACGESCEACLVCSYLLGILQFFEGASLFFKVLLQRVVLGEISGCKFFDVGLATDP
jgi:hypothetical protein